jgi:DMSO/TMAO reductase YedYZ heme-binding membrane subunit
MLDAPKSDEIEVGARPPRDAALPLLTRHWQRLLAHALSMAPLLWLAIRYINDTLPINLNRYLITRSGLIGLILLLASLACTPAALCGWRRAVQLRRPLGLYAFAYLVGHLLWCISYWTTRWILR